MESLITSDFIVTNPVNLNVVSWFTVSKHQANRNCNTIIYGDTTSLCRKKANTQSLIVAIMKMWW